MNIERKKKICIFFGAGSEISLGLNGGEDFAKAVVGIDTDKINSAIKNYYKKDLKEKNDWYPKYRSENSDEITRETKLVKGCLRKKLYIENNFEAKKEFDTLVRCMYNKIKNDESEKLKLIKNYTSYMGFLDESFHTLINPKALGPGLFWRVVTSYTRAYLFLLGKITQNEDEETYRKILNCPNEFLSKMNEFSKGKLDNYYGVIKSYIDKYDFNIVTTNYTTLCENITGVKADKIAYIHGKFGWFENPRSLEVIDINNDEIKYHQGIKGGDIYFPYIFIQSGVKPIVDRIQIREFSKMIDFFEKADVIIIIGYKFNPDDNHINSIIRSFICDGKRIKYFIYDNELKKEEIEKRLRIDKTYDNLEYEYINKNNCLDKFKEIIENI